MSFFVSAAILGSCLAQAAPAANQPQNGAVSYWRTLYVFGDSYSDSGAGYVDCNGPTAVAYLARDLGIPFAHPGDRDAGRRSLNFAVSGAETGAGDGSMLGGALLRRGIRTQVLDFVGRTRSGAIRFDPDRALFFMAGGLNDSRLSTKATVANLEDEIRVLYGLGARHFLVALLPTKIPAFAAIGLRLNPAITQIPKDLRIVLPGADIRLSHWGSYYDDVFENAKAYGFVNTHDPCAGRAIFGESDKPCANPDTYFYYHRDHPSTAVHRIVARELFREVLADVPPQAANERP